MTETINGLHSCKPGNDPVVGQVKTFVIQQLTGKSGKAYLKIKSKSVEDGGTPHRILSAEKTDFVDKHGNVSYNLEIEPSSSTPSAFQQSKAAMADHSNDDDTTHVYDKGQHFHEPDWPDVEKPPVTAPQPPPARSNGGGRVIMLDERQRAIIRQHSQSMALEVLKLKVTLNELTVEDLTPGKLRQLADYFDQDVYGATQ